MSDDTPLSSLLSVPLSVGMFVCLSLALSFFFLSLFCFCFCLAHTLSFHSLFPFHTLSYLPTPAPSSLLQRAKKEANGGESAEPSAKQAKSTPKPASTAAASASCAAQAAKPSGGAAVVTNVPAVKQIIVASEKDERLQWALEYVGDGDVESLNRSFVFFSLHTLYSQKATVQDTKASAVFKSLFNSSKPVRKQNPC